MAQARLNVIAKVVCLIVFASPESVSAVSYLTDRCPRTSKWFSFTYVLGVFPACILSLVFRARLYTSPLRVGSPYPIAIFLAVILVSFQSLAF